LNLFNRDTIAKPNREATIQEKIGSSKLKTLGYSTPNELIDLNG
jgi:hypothetical protein